MIGDVTVITMFMVSGTPIGPLAVVAIAAIAFSLGLYGYLARRRHRPRVAIGMGGSYIALLTGFYVDNGPFLPLWDQLPHITYWLLPSIVGVPLIWLALRRFHHRPAWDSVVDHA